MKITCPVKLVNFTTKRWLSMKFDVVILGGGVFGSSLLYHLAEEGLTNIALFERDQITCGTTWHTAGLVWRLRPNDIEIQLLNYTRCLMKSFNDQSSNTGYQENGGLFLASSEERYKEYQRLATLGNFFNVESYMLDPNEVKMVHPYLDTTKIKGALFSPGDGTVDPTGYCSTLVNRAKLKGAKVYENAKILSVQTDVAISPSTSKSLNIPKVSLADNFVTPKVTGVTVDLNWRIDDGGARERKIVNVHTPVVVNCMGVWAPEIASDLGITLPQTPLMHAYVLSESIFDLKGNLLPKYETHLPGNTSSNNVLASSSTNEESEDGKHTILKTHSLKRTLPNIRDHDRSVYVKIQGVQSFAFGGYENNPVFVFGSDNKTPVLSTSPFNLFDLNWEVFGQNLDGCLEILPILKDAGIKSTVCGYESFTPDHKPILGESLEIKGYYHGSGFNSSGMMLSGGCGREIAKLIARGYTDLDLYHFDIRRFNKRYTSDKVWVINRSHEAYAKNYSIVFPYEEPLAGRNMRRSPLYGTLLDQGCVYQERHGWERPGWFMNPKKSNPASPSLNRDDTKDRSLLAVKDYDFYGAYPDTIKGHELHLYADALKLDYTFEFPSHHFTTLKSECSACRDSAAIFDMSYFGKFYLCAREPGDAAAIVDRLFCTRIPPTVPAEKKNTFYTCALDQTGGIQCDLTVSVLRPCPDDTHRDNFLAPFEPRNALYYLAVGGAISQYFDTHARRVIREMIDGSASVPSSHQISDPESVSLVDATDKAGMISLQGPFSRRILQPLVNVDLGNEKFPFSSHKVATIGPERIPVRLVRVSFVGELGWEIHAAYEDCVLIYEIIMKTGLEQGIHIKNAGYRAIDSLSLEKGYYHWHAEIRTEDTPFEAGLGFTCNKLNDHLSEFLGRHSLLTNRTRDKLLKKIAFFTIDETVSIYDYELAGLLRYRYCNSMMWYNNKVPLFGLETIWRNDECVGLLRRAGYAYSLNKSVGYGYVHSPSFTYDQGVFRLTNPPVYITDSYVCNDGVHYEIESFGKRYPASAYLKSPFDPTNKRIKGFY